MKKFKLLFFSIACLTILSVSCAKDDSANPSTNAKMRITCTSSNPYLVKINGASHTFTGNSFQDFSLAPSSYHVSYEQISGYVLYPTTGSFDVTLNSGDNIERIIP